MSNPAPDAPELIVKQLTEWYWKSGYKREGEFQLPLADWLAPLYRNGSSIAAAEGSLRQSRPAMAIWGPSQTGKSTSVSAYMDAGATFTGQDADRDGCGSGLHWDGSPGFFFMAPMVDDPEKLPRYLTRKVLNPYNKGMDGSSCLTRFTAASLAATDGMYTVADPLHPVEVHLVTPRDLLHALGCGYNTECVGPEGRAPRIWNLDTLDKTLKLLGQKFSASRRSPVVREAFERMFDLTETLRAMAATPGGNWSSAMEDEAAFAARLRGMLEEPAFLADPAHVDELAAALLWEGQTTLTEVYRKMRDASLGYSGRGGVWHGKPVFASLEAAALFLNMGACEISYKARQPEESPEGILQGMMDKLCWRESEGTVFLDCEGQGTPLGGDPERFSILQGLVWELVVPVNMKNLPERPFPEAADRPNALKRFLEDADILDFPGVGNETKSLDNRILLDPREIERVRLLASRPDASNADKEKAARSFTAKLFFKEILKRGKTASIVATYARRLNIDSFSIFQGLRGYACPNADQLIHGIKSWWRHAVPEYAGNPVGESPLPLNIVLTWWATQLNKAVNPSDSNIYGVIEGIVSNLGMVRDPETAVTYALHYHNSPDRDFAEIKHDFSPGSKRYQNLFREPAFARQFQRKVSQQSFDSMITDTLTGGAQYFFEQALEQLHQVRANEATNRPAMLRRRLKGLQTDLVSLLQQRGLRPVERPRDERKERLEKFRDGLRRRVSSADGTQLKKMNHALRQLLDVSYDQMDPLHESIEAAYVEAQLNRWVRNQAHRYDQLVDPSGKQPLWTYLELDGADAVESVLRAMILSIRKDFPVLARWAHRLRASAADLAVRRLLAMRLQNALCFRPGKTRIRDDAEDWEEMETIDRPGYVFFLAQWLEPEGTIDGLIEREIQPVKRPVQAGDDEIETIARQLNLPSAEF